MFEAHTRSRYGEGTPLEILLAQVALGNREAFDCLYRGTANKLFGICLRVLAERSEAEDTLQDVFTTVWRKAAQFDATRASATTWLAMIARNKAIDRLRSMPARQARAALELALDVEDPTASPPQQAQTASDRARLERCLELLEPRRRSLVRAAFFDGSTYEELATRVQAPLGSIKSWIRRSLLQLRQCLDP
ncbi:MAG: polymerase sigma factor, sigma-70 family protein [Gammaproteobacteria bacterium]|nr:polymerase sigma factor, sigma-70 family protein [Gammaproteobacteria bacterium]